VEENNKQQSNNKKKFLGIWFDCCKVYGRLYKNKDETAYIGRCPRSMRILSVKIGGEGTDRRFFRAH